MRNVALIVLAIGVMGGVLFGCAGRWDMPFFWAYLMCVLAVGLIAMRVMDPELRKERFRPGPGGRDRLLRFVVIPFFLAHLVVAGLDAGRFHWSGNVRVPLRVTGLVGLALSYALVLWAVRVNRFYSPVVRIQSDRGHTLVTGGPYRWMRHPGYLASLLMLPLGAATLGSWWSLAPGLPVVVLILRRTAIEDRFLSDGLDGYREYAQRVRYRLVPGVW